METMTLTESCRSFAVSDEIDNAPSPSRFAKMPGEVFRGNDLKLSAASCGHALAAEFNMSQEH
jgi:hypothetical protein